MELFDGAYILHTRRYTDSRYLIEFFTEGHGLIRVVGRGPGKRNRSALQCFQLMDITWRGDSELKTLLTAEQVPTAPQYLTGDALFCGLYLNELLLRVLAVEDPYPHLFAHYKNTLAKLSSIRDLSAAEPILRDLEFFLLDQLGFGINLLECADGGDAILPQAYYGFEVGSGLKKFDERIARPDQITFLGRHLQAIASHNYSDAETLAVAKSICRQALAPLLGTRALKSRELFR